MESFIHSFFSLTPPFSLEMHFNMLLEKKNESISEISYAMIVWLGENMIFFSGIL
jgi:hypothetical protein